MMKWNTMACCVHSNYVLHFAQFVHLHHYCLQTDQRRGVSCYVTIVLRGEHALRVTSRNWWHEQQLSGGVYYTFRTHFANEISKLTTKQNKRVSTLSTKVYTKPIIFPFQFRLLGSQYLHVRPLCGNFHDYNNTIVFLNVLRSPWLQIRQSRKLTRKQEQ